MVSRCLTRPLLGVLENVSSVAKSQSRFALFDTSMEKPEFQERKELYLSLQERMDMDNHRLKHPETYKRIDIGFPVKTVSRKERIHNALNKHKLEMDTKLGQYSVDMDVIEQQWAGSEHSAKEIQSLATHYQIFEHLFGEFAYFHPAVSMKILYDFDEETYSPVYFGNLLKPKETSMCPKITFPSEPDSLWTLMLINPDGNLLTSNAEMMHWFVGNIPGGDISKGEEIINYLQPIPPKGTGFHRYVFLLYKQTERIDYSEYKKPSPCIELRDRTYYNIEFYKKYEDQLTPADLAWFQADYDSSLTDVFHKHLNMKEPAYEYSFPAPFVRRFNKHQSDVNGFNEYLDRYRDPKDISKEVFLQRLEKLDPLKGDIEVPKFPHVHRDHIKPLTPFWIIKDFKKRCDGTDKYKEYYKLDNRPRPPLRRELRLFGHKWSK